jgi:hypothetical protein
LHFTHSSLIYTPSPDTLTLKFIILVRILWFCKAGKELSIFKA